LDFLGKDSIQYVNTVKIRPEAYANMRAFVAGKQPGDNIFHLIDTSMLNDYLKTVVPGLSLTAKVFRTFNASTTLQKELDKGQLEGKTLEQKMDFYNYANKQVAILCNHQKAVSKNFTQQIEKDQLFLTALHKYCRELEEHRSLLKRGKAGLKGGREAVLDKKELVKKFPEDAKATERELERAREKARREQDKIERKELNKQISLNTSKTNYNDPRISVTWCKKNEVRIEKVFPKTLQSKFIWAMYEDPSF
jgi:DNA topoisomerase-1